jgi:polyisoprenoid-binding protein YceI
MRMSGRWKLHWLAVPPLCALLCACPSPPTVPSAQPVPGTAVAARAETPLPHLGTPYDVAPAESLLTILVFRAGALERVGHNHVIASHTLNGTLYLTPDPAGVSFEIHLPVDGLTVDEAALRAQQGSADFPPDVTESMKEGTRHNMLGSALLDVAAYPEIVLRALPASAASTGGSGPLPQTGVLQARVQAEVRGQPHTLTVPVRYERSGGTVTASGDFALRQSELGLTPFSALLGALQVQDEMRVRFQIVAHAAPVTPAQH